MKTNMKKEQSPAIYKRFHLSMLAVAIQTSVITFTAQNTIAAIPQTTQAQQYYQISAGRLDTVLNRFALQANVDISVDGKLTSGKNSAGLQGNYNTEQGFAQILKNSGLTAIQQSDVYVIQTENKTNASHNHQQTVQAENTTREITKLAPIIITASRSKKNISEIAGSVQEINQEQILQQSTAGKKVADILAQLVPSLAPSSGTTSNYGQSMRGRQVLVMIDGVSMNSSRDVSRQLNSISPGLIERIEIISGATSIYGSGATGGIINIITKRADETKPVSFETKLGLTASDQFGHDALSYELGQTASFAKDNLNGFLGLNYTSRGGMFDGNDNRIPVEPYQTDRSDTTTLDINGRLNIDLADQQTLSIGTQYYKDKQDTDYTTDYSGDFAKRPSYKAVKGLQLDDQPFTERYLLNTQYQHQDLFGQTLNLEGYYRKEKTRFFPVYTGRVYATQSEANIDVAGIRSTLQKDLDISGKALQLTYGLDYDYEKDQQKYDLLNASNQGLHFSSTGKSFGAGPDTTIQNIGTFLQSNFELTDGLNIQTGLRYQFIQADTDAYIPSRQAQRAAEGQSADLSVAPADSTHDGKLLFNFGAVFDLTSNQQIFANFSQGFSYPDVQRMFRDAAINSVSTANISPITVNSYEAGWRLKDENSLNLSITGFYNTSDKVVQFNADRSANMANTDQRVYGAETNISYPFLHDFKIGASYAYTRGQYKDANNQWRELNAYQISPAKATAFAEWEKDGYGLRIQSLTVQSTDKAFNDDKLAVTNDNVFPNTPAKIHGYTTMDVLMHMPIAKGRMDFGIYNLWNREYRTVYSQQSAVTFAPISSVTAQGRTFALSYTLNY